MPATREQLDDLALSRGEYEAIVERLGREPNTGRDHHPFAFSMFMAGGGIQGGQVLGRTDDIGWNPVEEPIHINDLHATILHLFGLDHVRLTHRFQGRDFRLTDVGGTVVTKLLA